MNNQLEILLLAVTLFLFYWYLFKYLVKFIIKRKTLVRNKEEKDLKRNTYVDN